MKLHKSVGTLIITALVLFALVGCRQVWNEDGPAKSDNEGETSTDSDTIDQDSTDQEVPEDKIDPDPKSIKIEGKHYILVDHSITLSAAYQHASTQGAPTITSWASNQESQADAATTNDGTIAGKAVGKDVAITATSSEGYTATHNVVVYSLELEHTDGSGLVVAGEQVGKGASITVMPKIEPSEIEAEDLELEYAWQADTPGGGDIRVIQNGDGTLTLEGVTEGTGNLIATDGAGNSKPFSLEVIVRNTSIRITGPRVVDIDFARTPYASSPTGRYGEYDKIRLTAESVSTGADTANLTATAWTSDNPSIAKVVTTNGGEAVIQGISPGKATIEAVADGAETSYEVQVVESTFITFDLSGVTAQASGDHAGEYRLELPLIKWNSSQTWEYLVDWGDGTAGNPSIEILEATNYDQNTNTYPEHYYGAKGVYTIRILNADETIGLSDWDFTSASVDKASGNHSWLSRPVGMYSASELTDVKRFGSGKFSSGMFAYCTNLESFSAIGTPQFAESISYMFWGASKFNDNISHWDVSGVKSMLGMFKDATAFNNGGAALTWGENTSEVLNMNHMFHNAENFNQDIGGWNVGSVNTMLCMFRKAGKFNQNLSRWNVSNVENMYEMFFRATDFINKGSKLDWSLSNKVVALNQEYTNNAGYNVSSMDGIFIDSGIITDFTNHPDRCICNIGPHRLP